MNNYSLDGLDPRFLNDLLFILSVFCLLMRSSEKTVNQQKHIKELTRHLMRLKLGLLDKHLWRINAPRHSKSSAITIAVPFMAYLPRPQPKILIISNPGR
jgi:hypothetical protein